MHHKKNSNQLNEGERKSHQHSGLGWFSQPELLTTPLLSTLRVSTLWGGVYPSPYPCIGLSPPRAEKEVCTLVEREREREREKEREKDLWGDQKSIKKCSKNHRKIHLKLTKNCSWRGPGGPLEPLGGHDRKKGGEPGFLEASWPPLGAVLGPFGGRLGPSWV